MPSQNVSLTNDLMGFVTSLVDTGEYASVSEVHRDAIRSLKAQKEREFLNRKRINLLLEEGERDLREGKTIQLNNVDELDAFFDQIDTEVTAELKGEYA